MIGPQAFEFVDALSGPTQKFNESCTGAFVMSPRTTTPSVRICPSIPPQITKYHKDVEFAYRPFLSLLGTGIVTSDGPKWRKQRNKVNTYTASATSSLTPPAVTSESRSMIRRETEVGDSRSMGGVLGLFIDTTVYRTVYASWYVLLRISCGCWMQEEHTGPRVFPLD